MSLNPSRRDVVSSVAAFTCVSAMSGSVIAASGALHLEVAEKARRLATGEKRLKLLMPHGCGANVAPVTAAFTELSGVEVELSEAAVDEINAQLTLDRLSGSADYDLALPATFGIPDLASIGIIRPLTAYAARHEPKGFRDDVLYAIGDSFDGELYGFQTDGDAYLMFYHRDWLEDEKERGDYADRYGVSLDVPYTWDELDRQMAFFHRPAENRYGGALFRTPSYLAWEWWMRFHAKGFWPLSEDLEPQIASDAGVSALEDMIHATESLYPQARSAGLFENWKQYGTGNIYANIGWGGSQKYLNGPNSDMRGRMAYGRTPSGLIDGQKIEMAYFNWGWNYVVTTVSAQPELAYLFALFASTSEVSTLSVRERDGYFDPFRPEHYADPIIQETYSPEFLAVHQDSMKAAIPDLYLAEQGDYFRTLSEWLDAALDRRLEPEEALKRIATQWSILNMRAGRETQRRRWLELRAKYPASARRALRDLPRA